MKIVSSKYKIGDKVRISKYKRVFEKGYTPNFTNEVFTDCKIVHSNPITYRLKDYRNQDLEGSFYEAELTKAKYDDVYLVEEILRRKGDSVRKMVRL